MPTSSVMDEFFSSRGCMPDSFRRLGNENSISSSLQSFSEKVIFCA
jgi:hypothetical protein